MADLSARVLQHSAFQQLDAVIGALGSAREYAKDDDQAALELARLDAITTFARTRLADADPSLVTDQVLETAVGNIRNLASYVSRYSSGEGRGHLSNAFAEADSLLGTIARVPGGTPSESATVRPALQRYHAAIEEYTRAIHERRDKLQAALDQQLASVAALEQRVAGTESRVDSIIGQYQQTFETAQAQRQQAFDSSQSARQQAADAELSTQRTSFSDELQRSKDASTAAAESAEKRTSELIATMGAAVATMNATGSEALTKLDKEYRDKADRLTAMLEERRKEADTLVGLIGERGVTSSYQKTANEARNEMYAWQVITVLVMGTLLAGAIFEFVPALKGGWNWGIGGARIMVATVATLFASYAGAQAKIARDAMRQNRRREMDLSALGPYLAPLPAEQQHEFRTRIADRYFVQDSGITTHGPGGFEMLLEDTEIAKAIKDLPKAAVLAALKAAK